MNLKFAFAGRIRSGKDTAALFVEEWIQERHDIPVERVGFADEIGRLIREYFPDAWTDGKPRRHYQLIGQTFRVLNPDIWVEQLNQTLNEIDFEWGYLNELPYGVIITDLRQQNELEYLHENGFVTIKVVSDDDVRLQRIAEKGDKYKESDLNHDTEVAVDSLETMYTITNNGSLEDLKRSVYSLLDELVANKT